MLVVLFVGMILYCIGSFLRGIDPDGQIHKYITWFSFLFLIPSIPWAIYRLGRFAKNRLFFKVRNRIIFFYLFTGVVPIILVLVITVLIVTMFLNNLSIIIYKNEIQKMAYRLQFLNSQIAENLYNNPEQSENPDLLYETIQTVLISEAPDLPDVGALFYQVKPRGEIEYNTIVSTLNWEEFQDIFLPDWLQKLPYSGVIIKNYSLFLYSHNRIELDEQVYYLDLFIPFREQLFEYLLANSNLRSFIYINQREIENDSMPNIVSYKSFNGFRGLSPNPIPTAHLQKRVKLFESEGSGEFALQAASSITATDWFTSEHLSADTREVRVSLILPYRTIISHLSSDSAAEELLMNALVFFLWVFLAMEIISIVIGVVIIRSVTRPVHHLSQGTGELRKGNLNYVIPLALNDELGQLSTSFNTMAQSIQALLNEVADKQRIQRELEIAKDVQRQFFPTAIPQLEAFALSGRCIPAREVSGDFYDFLQRSSDTLDVVLGDISGKGISAALLMASVQSTSRAQPPCQTKDGVLDPKQLSILMSALNKHLFSITPPEKFATLFYARFLTQNNVLQYCNGGHESPCLIKQDGEAVRLSRGGTILGAFPEMVFETTEITMQSGDMLAIFTDGLTDALNNRGEAFGDERLMTLLRDSRKMMPEQIVGDVLSETQSWFKGVSQHDDMTLVVVKKA